MIKILHITEGHTAEDGGVTTMLNELVSSFDQDQIQSHILAFSNNDIVTPKKIRSTKLQERKSFFSYFSAKICNDIRTVIKNENIDLIHLHGFWLPQQIHGARLGKELSKPVILTTHGMLAPWVWSGKGLINFLKKVFFFKLIARQAYSSKVLLHAITTQEEKVHKQLFPKCNQIRIPNSIEIELFSHPPTPPKPYFLFLGRVTPTKGIDLLIKAFANNEVPERYKLKIVGPIEDPSYYEKLQNIIKTYHLESRVNFLGPIFNDEKNHLYREATATILPSHSEAIGIVNLESAAMYTPSITTFNCGLDEWESEGGGLLVNPCTNEIKEAIIAATKWSEDERLIRGKKSRALVERKYSSKVNSKKWLKAYAEHLK